MIIIFVSGGITIFFSIMNFHSIRPGVGVAVGGVSNICRIRIYSKIFRHQGIPQILLKMNLPEGVLE